MKKVTIVIFAALMVFIFSIVLFSKDNFDFLKLNEATENQTESTTPDEYQNPELNNININKTDDWKTSGLKEVGLYNVEISNPLSFEFGNVYSISEAIGDGIYSSVYLAVETSDTVWITYTTDCYSNSIAVRDIDGETGEEIILSQTVGISGGAGSHNSSIWKVSEKGIKPIFDSNYFDSGFTSYLAEPFKLVISNQITGYKTTLDCEEKSEYIGSIFSEDGKPLDEDYSAMIDSYFEFEPIDVDGDGIYEIKCKQYTSLYSHADYIGDAEIIIRYNNDKEIFEIIDAVFVPFDE